MMYRLGFPLLIVAVLACIGIASAMGHNVLPETVLNILGDKSSSKGQPDVANLVKAEPSRQAERRSSALPNGGTDLSPAVFQDFFEVAQAGYLSDMTASLTFPQDSAPSGPQARGFVSGAGNPAHSQQAASIHSGSSWNPGSGSGGSGNPGSGGLAGSGSSGGSGSNPGSSGGTLDQNLVLASLMTGLEEAGNGGSKNPASDDDFGILPQTTHIPQPSFVPEADPLMGTPLEKVLPDPNEQRNPDPAPVPNPEPGTLILGGLGLAIMAVVHRRMRSRQGE